MRFRVVDRVLSLSARAPAPLKTAFHAAIPGGAVLLALSASGLFEPRVTRAPELPPAPSPWLVATATAQNDAACQLSLRVTDEGGSAVNDAHVSVVALKSGAVARSFDALTDAKGTHRLIDLDRGSYDVTVDVAGKALQGTPTFRCEQDGQRGYFDVVVKDSDHVVTGRLTGRRKAALPFASVALYQDDSNRTGLAGVVRTRTDGDGNFTARLPAGKFVVYASAEEHVARKGTLNVEAPTTKMALALSFSPAVRGVVVDEAGHPIANAVVAMGNAFDPRSRGGSVTTDETGHFAMSVQEGQDLELTARGDGKLGRAVVGTVDDVDHFQHLTIVATSGRTVSGVVFSTTGDPLAFGGVHYRVKALGLEGEAPTDKSGRFVLDGLPADLDVEVWAAGNATGAWGARVADPATSQLALLFVPPAY